MAAAGFTTLSLYHSTTTGVQPLATNLSLGELALNVVDGKLFYKNTLNSVILLADSGSVLPAIGPNGFILTSNGTSVVYTNPASITVGNATLAARATNIAGGFANQIVYQTGPNTTAFTPSPSVPGTVLSYNGTGFSWSVGVPSTTASNLLGGAAGAVPYQSAPDTTVFAVPGATGQVFTYSTGTSSPSWQTASVTLGSTVVNVNGATATTLAGLTSITVTQDPVMELEVATKQYVDNATTSGIHIHPPVVVDAFTNVPSTYAGGGTTVTVTAISGGTTLTSVAHGLALEDQVVPSVTANGLVAGTPYYVFSVVGPDEFTLSATPFGAQITTLTNGTGLSIALAANTGVGATLTSTTNGPLVIGTYTCQLNDRVLIAGQTNGEENGVYFISQVGVVGVSPWILTRTTDADKYIPKSILGLGNGSYFLVTSGSDAGNSYVCTNPGDIIFGTTNIIFTLFSQGGSGSSTPPALLVILTQNFGGF